MSEMLEYYQESGLLLEEIDTDLLFMESVDPVDFFFEDEDPEAAKKVETSTAQTKGIVAKIKKLIESIQKMISSAIEAISDFFKKMFMNADEKKVYDELKQLIKSNPELKNKKVTIKNVKEIIKKQDEALKMIDKSIEDMQNKDAQTCAEIRKKTEDAVNNLLNGLAGSTAAVVTADMAIRIAESSTENAKLVQKALDKEGAVMKQIEAQLGKARADELQKEVSKMTSILSLHRWKVRLLGQKHKGIASSIDQVFADFSNIIKLNSKDMTFVEKLKSLPNTMRIFGDALGAYNTHTGSNETIGSVAKKGYGAYKTGKHIRNEIYDAVGIARKRSPKEKLKDAIDNFGNPKPKSATEYYNKREADKKKKREKRDKSFQKAKENLLS